MSCFFCSSDKHVSHNCDVYKSDEEREEIIKQKNACPQCLSVFEEENVVMANPNEPRYCYKCVFNRKFYNCFSRIHHTAFCPHRFTALKMFPPNTDQNLLKRFIQVLNYEDQYSLFLSFPMIFDSVKLKPPRVTYKPNVSVSWFDELHYSDLDAADGWSSHWRSSFHKNTTSNTNFKANNFLYYAFRNSSISIFCNFYLLNFKMCRFKI